MKKGNDLIIELHDLLYSDILEKFLYNEIIYTPHITIGKLDSYKDFKTALNNLNDFDHVFETTIKNIYVEIINDDQSSIIELDHLL